MDVRRMIARIQIYIHHVKGVEVNISPDLPREFNKLVLAYGIADNWCNQNLV